MESDGRPLWYQMNSPGNVNQYFTGGFNTGLTPTVVSNFQSPNSGINKDGPYLEIVHQPQTKFRFRYKSEMAGTHGQLKAESSNKNNNVYPTVKLCNWNKGSALIRLMLYTADENANERKRHVHVLSGKSVHKEGYSIEYDVVADEKNNYTPHFSNLGIIHIAKRDVENIIFQRKKEGLITNACARNPDLLTKSIQHNISPTDLHKLSQAAKEEAKSIDLNKVVLRFQAFFLCPEVGCYKAITEPVDSDVIFNLKNASTGELKIVRLSAAYAPCVGGTEIWMLVEKVNRKNVKIKFYELDSDNCEVWKAYGEFRESDVHHQYAIVFKVPAYERTNIREPVHVKIQLERPSDHDTSEPLDFTFIPETLKRGNDFLDRQSELDFNPMKKVRSTNTAMDLKKKNNLFLEGREFKQPYSPETPFQSPAQMVPSPIGPEASPSQGFPSPLHQGGIPSVHVLSNEEDVHFIYGQVDSPNNSSLDYGSIIEATQSYTTPSTFTYQTTENMGSNVFRTSENSLSPPYQSVAPGSVSSNQASPYHQVPSPSFVQSPSSQISGYNMSPFYGDLNSMPTSETAQHQIQQFDAIQKNFECNMQSQSDDFDFKDLVSMPVTSKNMDLLSVLDDQKLYQTQNHPSNGYGDIHVDSAVVEDSPEKKQPSKYTKKDNVDAIAKTMSTMSMEDEPAKIPSVKKLSESDGPTTGKDLAFRVAVKAAECLQIYAASGDISRLLATHRFLLGVQNNEGDNSLHTAVRNRNFEAFNKIISAAREVFCSDLLNTQNYAGETPLHLAIRENEVDMIKVLVRSPGSRLDIVDYEGNNVFHLASYHLESLKTIIGLSDKKHLMELINTFNYNGQTPLHIAVCEGNTDCVKLLVNSGAEVHQCERKIGANPLHLAVSGGQHSIAQFLISNTDVTVDAGRFDGNTALHIAALAGDAKLCIMLMEAQANPHARNSLRKTRQVSESEQDDEDSSKDDEVYNEENFFSPFDYAGENQEVIEILKGNYVSTEKEECKENIVDSGIGISATDLQDTSG